MRRAAPPSPWPAPARAWWVYGATLAVIALYSLALAMRLHCRFGGCGDGPLPRLLDLDAVGGLPRLLVTGLFVLTAVLARRAGRAAGDRARPWWTAVAVLALALAVVKVVSLHSMAKSAGPGITVVVSVVGAAVVLTLLHRWGRRLRVAGSRAVVVALGVYVAAALGLDVLTWVFTAVQQHAGSLSEAAATFVEELGEALAALGLVVTVRRQARAQAFWRAR